MRDLAIYALAALLAGPHPLARAERLRAPYPQLLAYCALPDTPAAECLPGPAVEPFTPDLWAKVLAAKATADATIEAVPDAPGEAGDTWRALPEGGGGDCDDWVMTQRRLLIGWGVSPGALRMLAVRTPADEGHLVLEVVTDRGRWVLDNLARRPYALADMPHTPYAASTEDPLLWEDLRGSRAWSRGSR